MEKNYTDERNIQMLIYLLKKNNIKKIIVSPGATNVSFVGSVQNDEFFEVYSCVDERSAAYMACGLSFATKEPVVLSCTGATASRNYYPGLTEAYYRKLPILAVTSTQVISRLDNMIPQVIDRSQQPKDLIIMSQYVQTIRDSRDEKDANLKLNRAILELKHRGGGPVHINLETIYSKNYTIKEIPPTRVIERITKYDEKPAIPNGKIGVLIGAHERFSNSDVEIIDNFCAAHDAVVFVDHTSNYYGKYRMLYSLAKDQRMSCPVDSFPSFIIHIGEVTGDYTNVGKAAKEVWRVCENGHIQDPFESLTKVFEMPEMEFFKLYTPTDSTPKDNYLKLCANELNSVRNCIPNLPFSNAWIASKTASLIPKNSFVYLSILNTLRLWNFFEMDLSVTVISNTGGFGIDGILSSLVGASFADKSKLHFAIIGDLAFFYDMNALGNHHIGNNVRVLLVNNGRGIEFRNYDHPAQAFGDEADKYMAAAGHFGNKSHDIVKHYAEDLGFEYLSANNKEDYLKQIGKFTDENLSQKPILFEVFTETEDESNALKEIRYCRKTISGQLKAKVKEVIGDGKTKALKKLIGK